MRQRREIKGSRLRLPDLPGLVPGQFRCAVYAGEPWTFLELLSLSFTNLSATGLGDIRPVPPPAHVRVILEQFAGIDYIAVVFSRLIGLTLGGKNER